MRRFALLAPLWVLSVLTAMAPQAAAQMGEGPPKARLDLVSSVKAAVPGEPFEVAVRFDLDEEWHIYWHDSGESGRPPLITWKLPEGWTAGEPKFPLPKRHVAAGITTNILDGTPALLVDVVPPSDASGEVTLAADVRYLVCREFCLIERAELSLKVPVAAADAEVEPDNANLFRRWHRSQPKAESKYLSVQATTEPATLSAGAPFVLKLEVDIAKGYYVQSNRPAAPSLIAFDVYTYRQEGMTYNKPLYPPATTRPDRVFGELSLFTITFEVRVPGLIEGSTEGPFDVRGVIVYQACDNQGHCFPPDGLAFEVASAAAPAERVGAAGRPAAESPTAVAGSTSVDAAAENPTSSEEGGGLSGSLQRTGFVGLLAACFLYGLFINATPCVLPLLSIKVLGFVQQARESRSRTLGLGLAFGAGVMLFFMVLGLLASAGKNVLQYPAAVIALGAIVMALALSMLGVYTLQVPTAATRLEASIRQEGMAASFGKGALAPVLGFACTGPLLASAFAWATQQPPHIAIIAFLVAGLGMASPYMLLGANPNWLSFLPKPGQWMITFERVMGFLLLGMVVWLIHPLAVQIGVGGLEWTLGFFVVVGFACWLLGQIDFSMSAARRWRYRGSAIASVVVAAFVVYGWLYPIGPAQERARAERRAALAGSRSPDDFSQGLPWQLWSPEAVEKAVLSGRTVFVDFTAAYCTQCKINKAVAIDTPPVLEKFRAMNVALFLADFTDGDEEIYEALQRHDRPGVPMNLIYPPGRPDAPMVLDTVLTASYLIEKLNEAGPSRIAAAD